MEEERVFRVSKRHRKHPVIAIGIVLFGLLLIILLTKPASRGLIDHARYLVDLGWARFALFMVVMVLLVLVLVVVEYRSYRLVFSDTYFESRGLQTRWSKRRLIKYSDVVRLGRSAFGQLMIDTKEGKRFPLNIKRLEGGTKGVLDEFRKHIAEQRFEKGLEEGLDQLTKGEKIVFGLVVFAVLMMFIDMFYEDVYEEIKNDVAWSMEVDGSWEENLEDVVLGEDGAIWVLVQEYPGEWDDPETYEVRKYLDGEKQAMRLPSSEELFPEGLPARGLTSPQSISLGENELPVLDFFPGQRQLLWTGSSWEWGPEPVEEVDDKNPVDDLAERTGDDYWNKLESERTILVMDPGTGKAEEVDLDNRDDDYWLRWYETAKKGWIVVSVDGSGDRKFIHSFEGTEEEKVWYELEMPTLPLEEYAWILDYTVDVDGNIYMLVRGQEFCKDDVETSYVGKLNEQNGVWEWRMVKHKDACIFPSGIDQILVDSQGRIWLPASGSLAVVEPIVFAKDSVLEEDYSLYTEDNSGYFIGHEIIVGPDGRFWSLDMSGYGLVWIDPNVDELEKPIPSWIAGLMTSLGFSIGMTVSSSGLLLVLMIILYFIVRRGNAPPRKPEI